MTKLRVEVIRERCAGYANCLEIAPGIFDLDDDDVAVAVAEHYPLDQRERLEEAVRRCPPKAIIVTEV